MGRAIKAIQWLVLGAAGVAAFYAAAHLSGQLPGDAGGGAAPVPRTAASQANQHPSTVPRAVQPLPAPASSIAHTDRVDAIPGETGEPFASMSWVAPPPPPPKPLVVVAPPPPPPVAPPLPFTFVGLVEKGTPRPQAFLSKGDELLVVSLGDLLENGAYRVDGVNAGQIAFTHLPTGTKQVINLSGGAQ